MVLFKKHLIIHLTTRKIIGGKITIQQVGCKETLQAHSIYKKKQKTNKTHNIQPLEERASKYRCSPEWQRINDTKNSKISV